MRPQASSSRRFAPDTPGLFGVYAVERRVAIQGEESVMDEGVQADCLFCRIVSGEIPSESVYGDEVVYAFRDINPGAPTHTLIVPRRHIADVAAPEAADGELLLALVRAANEIAQQEGIAASGY